MRDDAKSEVQDPPVEMGELTDSLGFLIRIAQIKSFENFFERLGDQGLMPGEFTVLWTIGMNPGLRQGTIARALKIKPAHMTKLTGRLAKSGLVERTVSPDDRRAVGLSLTKEGHHFVETHKDDFLDVHFTEKADMDAEEALELVRLLKKFTGLA